MDIPFKKYHGTGNDFVIIDNRSGKYELTPKQVAFICHRRFGIGADGLMLLQDNPAYDFEMRYFNSDGAEASMCGNGGRCLTSFAYFDAGSCGANTEFLAVDGPHKAKVLSDGSVELKMQDVSNIVDVLDGCFIDTGSPHYVQFCHDIDKLNVFEQGRDLRNRADFAPGGCNVNFVQRWADDRIKVRTYERGVEDETLSCGTGVVASAIAAVSSERAGDKTIYIETRGGDLSVKFTVSEEKDKARFSNIWLCGPARFVFSGRIKLQD